MRKLCALFSFVLAQQIGSAAYTYYQSYTGSATGFTQNGTLISVSNSRGQGFTASSANGGSLISATAVPDGSFNYEAAMTLGIGHSGVTYTLYVLASPDALAGSQTATGTYYSVALTPTIASNGTCSGSLVINERNHGSVFMVGSKVIPCRDGMTLHAVTAPNGQLNIYGDAPTLTPMFLGNFYITSGGSMTGDGTTQNPLGLAGFGISGAPSGSSTDYIVNLRVGPLDQTAPNAIVNVNAYPLANQVTLHAPGTTDTNGVGVGMYYLWRNGAFLQESPTPDFADTSVQPGTQYQYMIAASNFHSKFSQGETISVTTLAAGAMDPREVGLRPTGTYWGGSGEQIDVLSGNLNYSYPLITAQGRGWSVPIGLSYNSQNWVQDASGTNWHFGNDSGMGYGWNLQVGALRKYTLGDGWTASYYEFRDSTDAVYRLDQNANGIWSSTQSLYVWYDSNANKLHFANGTFGHSGVCLRWASRMRVISIPRRLKIQTGTS